MMVFLALTLVWALVGYVAWRLLSAACRPQAEAVRLSAKLAAETFALQWEAANACRAMLQEALRAQSQEPDQNLPWKF